MAHFSRPRFKRSTEEWVALMPITLADGVIAVGDTFKKGAIRQHVLRNMYLRGRIGPAGHPWTAQALERRRARLGTKPEAKEEEVTTPGEDTETDQAAPPTEEAPKSTRRRRSTAKANTPGDS